jgi:hypothetical protein
MLHGFVATGFEIDGLQQQLKRAAHGLVVIYDVDDRLLAHRILSTQNRNEIIILLGQVLALYVTQEPIKLRACGEV